MSWVLLACAKAALPTVSLTVGSAQVRAEVADEPAERQQGLMYRDALGADDGMLFVYPDAQERSFWMKNTRVALSIAYLDADGRVVHVTDMVPYALDGVPSGAPAAYALEVNRGWYQAHGVKVGDHVGGLPPLSAH